MKQVGEVISQGRSEPSMESRLTAEQKDAVGYFFARVRVIYGHQYAVNYPDEATERFAKREYASQLCEITRERMDQGFNALHLHKQQNPEEWRFLDMDKIIGLVKTGGQHWAHRVMAAADRETQKALPLKRDPDVIARGAEMIKEARKGLK